jgi:hypothetical protein
MLSTILFEQTLPFYIKYILQEKKWRMTAIYVGKFDMVMQTLHKSTAVSYLDTIHLFLYSGKRDFCCFQNVDFFWINLFRHRKFKRGYSI